MLQQKACLAAITTPGAFINSTSHSGMVWANTASTDKKADYYRGSATDIGYTSPVAEDDNAILAILLYDFTGDYLY